MRWVRDRAFPVRNQKGELYRIAGIAEDITEQRRTREALQTQAAILENMAEGVVVTDEQGVIVQMNPAGERLWGFEHNEVLGQPVSVLSGLPEPEATAGLREVLGALQTEKTWRGTFQDRRKDGATIICDAAISRLEVQGRVLFVALEQDVTGRVQVQEQLQMQARVLESMAEAVLMVDENGTILLTNPALDALLGYERGELVGKPMLMVSSYSPEEFRQVFAERLEQVKAHGSVTGEYLARQKDGSVIEVEIRGSGMTFGGRYCLVLVGQDITERKRAELTKEVLLELGTKLSAATNAVQVARAVFASADQICRWDSASLDLYSPDTDQMQPVLNYDIVDGRPREVPSARPECPPTPRARRIMRDGPELILEKRPSQVTDFTPFGDTSRLSASMLYVPLHREGQAIWRLVHSELHSQRLYEGRFADAPTPGGRLRRRPGAHSRRGGGAPNQ